MVEAHPVPPVSNISVDSIPMRILGTHDSHEVAVALMGSIEREAGRPDKVLAEEPELSRAGPERARKRVQASEWHLSAVVVDAWWRNAHGCRGELRYRAIDAPKVARKSPVATQASRTALKYGVLSYTTLMAANAQVENRTPPMNWTDPGSTESERKGDAVNGK